MAPSIVRSIPVPPQRPSAPSYHHYVTSMLHRRWVRACLWVLAIGYAEAFLTTNKRHIFWTLFTVVPIKAIVIWLFTLPVLIMRIHLVHLGAKSLPSAAHDIRRALGSFNTYATFLAYVLSAGTIVVLYMFTSDDKDQLGITYEPKATERPRLNERCLYLVFLAFYMAGVHTVSHLSSDRDRIDLPSVTLEASKDGESSLPGVVEAKQMAAKEKLLKEINRIFLRALRQTLFSATTGMIVYLPFRRTTWSWTLKVARVFYRLSNIAHPHVWPVGFWFFFRSLWICMLVFTLWECGHAAFSWYFSMTPMKESKTLSSGSRDPNGTLVTGLKQSTKPFTQAIAFWELCYIAHNEPARRKAMLMDIDRARPIWDDIMQECLRVIDEAQKSIAHVEEVPAAVIGSPLKDFSVSGNSWDYQGPQYRPFSAVPNGEERMKTIRDDDVFVTPVNERNTPSKLSFFKSGEPQSGSNVLLDKLPPVTPDFSGARNALSDLNSVGKSFIKSKAGIPFRQTVKRKTAGLIPNVSLQIDAISAIAKFVEAAIKDDEFGIVQHNVPTILEKFFDTIDVLDGYVTKPPIHWTDVDTKLRIGDETLSDSTPSQQSESSDGKPENASNELKEPLLLLNVLKTAARDVVDVYYQYLQDLGLNIKLAKRARDIASKRV
ncbi:nucleoporin protein Ndc1-Nup [Peziza echinospora]|nr:nucleoporin protein Ndc1-Nup [Peziza echinospora]